MITDPYRVTEEQADGLVEMIQGEGKRGMTSRDITALNGKNIRPALEKLERGGRLKSRSTNVRCLGRRWFTPENYTE